VAVLAHLALPLACPTGAPPANATFFCELTGVKCYLSSGTSTTATFFVAQDACQSRGGGLVQYMSYGEQVGAQGRDSLRSRSNAAALLLMTWPELPAAVHGGALFQVGAQGHAAALKQGRH
jgi:hypothetical protein